MRSVSYRLADLIKARIPLGFVGENEHTVVQFDAKQAFDQYPTATPSLTVKNPSGEKYPAVVVRDGDMVIWTISDSDLIVPGRGEFQLQFKEGDTVMRSYVGETRIEHSIMPTGDVPTPVQNWIDAAEDVLEEVDEAIPTGGTTGQVLAKKSDADRDTEWVDQTGGGGGTSNYNDLSNKPQIGGVTLSGNKTLHDLGAAAEEDIPVVHNVPAGGSANQVLAKNSGTDYDLKWVNQSGGGGGAEIDDTAGEGDTDVVWSADKTWTETEALKEAIAQIENSGIYKEVPICDGYNASNATAASLDASPFMVAPVSYGKVKSIKLKIKTTGNLSIGTIKASDATIGQAFDFTKVNVHEVLVFSETGEQTKVLSTEMPVVSGEYIVLGVRTDTATFYFGNYGTDKGFRWVHTSLNTVQTSTNSLGVTFSGIKVAMESVYTGKTLSILGDSISTFDGYIPEGNVTYYPTGTVTTVSDTWWYKLMTALGMTLNVNNSWSGSRVTTTGGDSSAGCGARSEALGTTPDVIIVWMGINDFNNEVALGTYDGTTAIPETTTTFREAYGIMLNKILTAYKTSEVWVCTLPQCERNGESDFPEINGNGVALAEFNKAILELANAFGVKVLDHNKCGLTYQNMSVYNPDNLHPNKDGHSLVANNDIWQMDAFVRVRY